MQKIKNIVNFMIGASLVGALVFVLKEGHCDPGMRQEFIGEVEGCRIYKVYNLNNGCRVINSVYVNTCCGTQWIKRQGKIKKTERID
jgi:hypothetical protein